MIKEMLGIWGGSHTGWKRKQNEDRFLMNPLPGITILAVADGMGGHAGGDIAAQIVIDTFREYRFTKENLETDLRLAFKRAEKRLRQHVSGDPGLDGMGTTLTTAALHRNKVYWIHVGDSRMYLLHGRRFERITTDHTYVQELIAHGALTLEQASNHPLKNVLDKCLGLHETEPDQGVFHMEKNDRLLLCSDGLTKHLSDLEIESLLRQTPVQEAARVLILAALKKGGSDNVTVIVKEG